MRAVVLSPHRDDAAFSCGLTILALLRAGVRVDIVNVYTRSDYAVDLSSVGASLPLADAVSRARRKEDESFVSDAVQLAGCKTDRLQLIDLWLLDAPLRLAVRTEQVLESPLSADQADEEAEKLAGMLQAVAGADFFFAPLAIGDHIDHRIVRDAARKAVPLDRLCLYEDLPYAARVAPSERKPQSFRAVWSKGGSEIAPFALQINDGPFLKGRFARHYSSQIADEVAEEMAAYAAQSSRGNMGAERWWTTRETGRLIANQVCATSSNCSVVEGQE